MFFQQQGLFMNDEIQLRHWIFGYQISQAIYTISKLKIPDEILKKNPIHYKELADRVEAHPETLYRLLRALATLEIFQETEEGYFDNTSKSKLLLTQENNPLYQSALFNGREAYQAWSRLSECITDGTDGFTKQFGMDLFKYAENQAEFSDLFNQYASSTSKKRFETILNHQSFPEKGQIVDIGGGHGHFMVQLLEQHPQLMGIVFDTSNVIQSTPQYENSPAIKSRLQFISGNFFEFVPKGDFYILANILHDWDDASAIKILTNCRKQLNDNGKLLIIEKILSPHGEVDFSAWMDLNMLIMQRGKERTLSQYTTLLSECRFRIINLIHTQSNFDLIECI